MSAKIIRRCFQTQVLPSVAELLPTQSQAVKKKRPKSFQVSLQMEERAEKLIIDSSHNLGTLAEAAESITKRHGMSFRKQKDAESLLTNHTCLAYLIGRFPAECAALSSVFSEMKSLDPDWEPESCFDSSSRLNAVSWMATKQWPGIEEIFCVDLDKAMLDLGEKFCPSVDEKRNNRKMFFRQFLPANPDPVFDLVVSSYASNSTMSFQDDLWKRTTSILWEKTGKYLVFVEPGTNAGFLLLNGVREQLLAAGATIVAPCPHQQACPRLGLEKLTPCAFGATFKGFHFADKWLKGKNSGVEQYSYLVVRKGERISRDESDPPMSRIIRPVIKRHKHAVMRLCCPDGCLREIIPSRGKHEGPNRELWKWAKLAAWGERVPLSIQTKLPKERRPVEEQVEKNNRPVNDIARELRDD